MKRFISIVLCAACFLSLVTAAFAHSGRTDASGGHRDNKNASGLGYYHYHHGYSAHLHPNGVCPYASGGTVADNGSGIASGVREESLTSASAAPDNIVLDDAENTFLSGANNTLSSGGHRLKIEGSSVMSYNLARSLAKVASSYGRSLQVYADVVKDNAVACRMSCDPAACTKDIVLAASLDSEQAVKTRSQFEKWFGTNVFVVSCTQAGSFGVDVRVAVKADLVDFGTDSLHFYAYDAADNSYSLITDPDYSVDDNGYLWFTTPVGGDIVISSGPLRA